MVSRKGVVISYVIIGLEFRHLDYYVCTLLAVFDAVCTFVWSTIVLCRDIGVYETWLICQEQPLGARRAWGAK